MSAEKTNDQGAIEIFGWCYASSKDAEIWHGPCKTREEAIAQALDLYGDERDPTIPVWVSPCRPVKDTDEDAEPSWTFMRCGNGYPNKYVTAHRELTSSNDAGET